MNTDTPEIKEPKFKIGDIVEFGTITNAKILDIEGRGELLAIAREFPMWRNWIVLITERHTDFLKNRPEKALIIPESQMKVIK